VLCHFDFFLSVLSLVMLETVVDHQDGFSGDFESHLSILGLIEVEACHHAFEHEIES